MFRGLGTGTVYKDKCKTFGATLASITSAEEQAFVHGKHHEQFYRSFAEQLRLPTMPLPPCDRKSPNLSGKGSINFTLPSLRSLQLT